jgi:hypothetical protein
VPRGSEASRAERLPTVVSGRSVSLVSVLREGIARAPRLDCKNWIRTAALTAALSENEKTQLPRPPRPTGSSQGGEHVGCDAARSWYRKRDSARDVTPASLVAGAGGAALAYSEHSAWTPPDPSPG